MAATRLTRFISMSIEEARECDLDRLAAVLEVPVNRIQQIDYVPAAGGCVVQATIRTGLSVFSFSRVHHRSVK